MGKSEYLFDPRPDVQQGVNLLKVRAPPNDSNGKVTEANKVKHSLSNIVGISITYIQSISNARLQ